MPAGIGVEQQFDLDYHGDFMMLQPLSPAGSYSTTPLSRIVPRATFHSALCLCKPRSSVWLIMGRISCSGQVSLSERTACLITLLDSGFIKTSCANYAGTLGVQHSPHQGTLIPLWPYPRATAVIICAYACIAVCRISFIGGERLPISRTSWGTTPRGLKRGYVEALHGGPCDSFPIHLYYEILFLQNNAHVDTLGLPILRMSSLLLRNLYPWALDIGLAPPLYIFARLWLLFNPNALRMEFC